MSISRETLSITTVRALAKQELDFSLTPDESRKYCQLCFRDSIAWIASYARYILTSFYEQRAIRVLGNQTDGGLDIFRILLSPNSLDLFNKLDPIDQQQFLIKVLFWLETITSHPSAINPKAVLRNHGKRHRVRGPKPNWFEHYLIRRHDKE